MRLATASDFEHGPLYDTYHRFPFFATRADWLTRRFGTSGKWLIVGCGWGFGVDELLSRGVDAWGVDASAYAKQKASEQLPAASAARVLQVDTTNRSQLGTARAATGLTGNQRFTLAVTEDVLPCLTDTEIAVALTELRRIATTVVHLVTPANTDDPDDMARRVSFLNWKKPAVWKALVTPDVLYDEERQAEVI